MSEKSFRGTTQRSPRDCSHEGLGQELPVVARVGQGYRKAG